jgi:hypothetical protein
MRSNNSVSSSTLSIRRNNGNKTTFLAFYLEKENCWKGYIQLKRIDKILS